MGRPSPGELPPTPDLVRTTLTPAQKTLGQHDEVVRGMDPLITNWMDSGEYTTPASKIWQPSDLLPNSQSDGYLHGIGALRERAAALTPGLLVVLVGDTVTEEALPTYQTWLNRVPAIRDETGVDQTGWARWSRRWTAEENRHGDVLTGYLGHSGRVDMRAVQQSTMSLIENGFDPRVGEDPYAFLVYTSFQEAATQVSHRNVAGLARKEGAVDLAAINGRVAGDEGRHMRFYSGAMHEVFRQDPEGGVIAYRDMLRAGIVMPATLMTDGEPLPSGTTQSGLYQRFADVAQGIGVYTARDYHDIMANLGGLWNVQNLQVTGEAAKAQEQIGRLTTLYEKRADQIVEAATQRAATHTFPWVTPKAA